MQHRSFPFARSLASIPGVSTDPTVTPPLAADEQAFTSAVQRHRAELQRHCVRLTGSPADAEDALQETLLRAWRSRRTRSSDSPRGWLYRIATNACFDVRAGRDSTMTSLDDETVVAHHTSAPSEQRPDSMLLTRETVELALLTAIQHLPPRQQATFVMRDVLSWSANEVATALSTSVPATNSSLQRARTGLRAPGCESPGLGMRRPVRVTARDARPLPVGDRGDQHRDGGTAPDGELRMSAYAATRRRRGMLRSRQRRCSRTDASTAEPPTDHNRAVLGPATLAGADSLVS
jgi:RNA polymerase sigma factor (sigma-70 family)